MTAVAATIAEDVPTAMGMGTPQSRTIRGTLIEPHEMPTAPASSPANAVIGIVYHKLTA